MNSQSINDLILQDLDRSMSEQDRISKIDELLHMLNFERRLAALTAEQRHAMMLAGESRITDEMRQKIDACKTDVERNNLIDGFARAVYMRQCAWSDYLNGVSKEMPFFSSNHPNVKLAS